MADGAQFNSITSRHFKGKDKFALNSLKMSFSPTKKDSSTPSPSSKTSLKKEKSDKGWKNTFSRMYSKKYSHLLAKSNSFEERINEYDSSSPVKQSSSTPYLLKDMSVPSTPTMGTKSTASSSLLTTPPPAAQTVDEISMFKNIPQNLLNNTNDSNSNTASSTLNGTPSNGVDSGNSGSSVPQRSMYSCNHEGCNQSFNRFHLLNKHIQDAHQIAAISLVAVRPESGYREERHRLRVEVEQGWIS